MEENFWEILSDEHFDIFGSMFSLANPTCQSIISFIEDEDDPMESGVILELYNLGSELSKFKNISNPAYLEKILIDWHEKGVRTKKEAKILVKQISENYNTNSNLIKCINSNLNCVKFDCTNQKKCKIYSIYKYLEENSNFNLRFLNYDRKKWVDNLIDIYTINEIKAAIIFFTTLSYYKEKELIAPKFIFPDLEKFDLWVSKSASKINNNSENNKEEANKKESDLNIKSEEDTYSLDQLAEKYKDDPALYKEILALKNS